MNIPECPSGHGQMVLRDTKRITEEQKWCGTWYDCEHPGCFCSVLVPSVELSELYQQHGQRWRKQFEHSTIMGQRLEQLTLF